MIYASKFELFLLRKHYCTHCGNLLNRKKTIRIIDRKSEEARQYGGDANLGFIGGDVKLTTYCLECKTCNTTFTVKEQREIEKLEKARKKEKRKEKTKGRR